MIVRACLQNAKAMTGEDLLMFWVNSWREYTSSSKVVNSMFNYLNRHWLKLELDKGNQDVCEVYTVSWGGGGGWQEEEWARGVKTESTVYCVGVVHHVCFWLSVCVCVCSLH